MEINQEVLDNAVEIYANVKAEDCEPYCPSNGTEGELFAYRWCGRCQFDLVANPCEILTYMLCGIQQKEWIYIDDKPACTAFKRRLGGE
jgi:hypothetical protein